MLKNKILAQKVIILTIFVFVIISVLFIRYAGSKQDELWLADYNTYLSAGEHYKQSRLEEAEGLYAALLEKPAYQDSVEMNIQMGLIATRSQENYKALEYYKKARKAFPAIVNNPAYLKACAFTLVEVRDFERAEKYLDRIIKVASSESDRQWASQAIQAIKAEQK